MNQIMRETVMKRKGITKNPSASPKPIVCQSGGLGRVLIERNEDPQRYDDSSRSGNKRGLISP